ncbi:MAG: hypothetical protein KJN92_10445 [Gemmatimonadetes bacterium]|nr:hypothetical protein [Gemmatimonadota bacterium]
MRFAAGLTVTGVLSLLLLEALKVVLIPVSAWLLGVLVVLVKAVLIALVLLVAAAVIGGGVWLYKRGQKSSVEV